jgi:hypothetical protein
MKAFSKLSVALYLALGLGSSCTHYIYQPATIQSPDVDVVYAEGRPDLRSQADSVEVYTAVTSNSGRMLDVQLMVYNNSDHEVEFNPEKLLVSGFDQRGRKVPFRVFTAKEYIRRRNTRNALIIGAAVVGTVGLAIALDKADGKPSASRSRDGAARNAEVAVDAAYAAFYWMPVPLGPVHRPPDALLRRHTLFPGETLQGSVKVLAEPEFMDRILVETPVNNRYLKFAFNERKK